MGDYYYHSKYDEFISRWLRQELDVAVPQLNFTERECQLVVHISKGETSNQIAQRYNVSPRSVDSGRAELMRKIGASNTSELVAFFYKCGMLTSKA
ncbi:MAG: helix-turn-helix transcriptional regulator [Bacteroidota bacterium]